MTTEIKSKDRNSQQSVDRLRKISGYEGIQEENFQQGLGGPIEILIGQNIGQDFFPQPIVELDCGLKISKMRIPLQDENRYLSFSGRLPTPFVPIYNKDERFRALDEKETFACMITLNEVI